MRRIFIAGMILLAAFLLPACQAGGTAPAAAPTETQPAAAPIVILTGTPTAAATPGEAYPMNPPNGSDSSLVSAYPPAGADRDLQRGNFFVEEAGVMAVQGRPGEFDIVVAGSLPTPCNNPRAEVIPPDADNRIIVNLYTVVDPNMMCTQVIKPFSGKVATISGLPSGSYAVVINDQEVGKIDVP